MTRTLHALSAVATFVVALVVLISQPEEVDA